MAIKLQGLKKIFIEETSFMVRPPMLEDYAKALNTADELGLKGDPKKGFINAYSVMCRIVDWDVENGNGERAECTEQNKMQLFGQAPEIMTKLAEEIGAMEQEKKTTGSSSQRGSRKGRAT